MSLTALNLSYGRVRQLQKENVALTQKSLAHFFLSGNFRTLQHTAVIWNPPFRHSSAASSQWGVTEGAAQLREAQKKPGLWYDCHRRLRTMEITYGARQIGFPNKSVQDGPAYDSERLRPRCGWHTT